MVLVNFALLRKPICSLQTHEWVLGKSVHRSVHYLPLPDLNGMCLPCWPMLQDIVIFKPNP